MSIKTIKMRQQCLNIVSSEIGFTTICKAQPRNSDDIFWGGGGVSQDSLTKRIFSLLAVISNLHQNLTETLRQR